MTVTSFLIIAAVGYLIGSIPFGLILTRLAGLGDIRKVGSGNIGATNVLRTGSKPLAAATLVCDILKGTAAVLIAPIVASKLAAVSDSSWTSAHTAGLAAFAGHLFPIWLSFRGGKGVATYIGVAAGLAVPIAIVFCGIWLVMAALFRFSSLSAFVASVAAPLSAALFSTTTTAFILALMSVLLIARHRDNIARLLQGKEPKIGAKS